MRAQPSENEKTGEKTSVCVMGCFWQMFEGRESQLTGVKGRMMKRRHESEGE